MCLVPKSSRSVASAWRISPVCRAQPAAGVRPLLHEAAFVDREPDGRGPGMWIQCTSPHEARDPRARPQLLEREAMIQHALAGCGKRAVKGGLF